MASALCLGPELDIFERRKINAGILACDDIAVRPITSLNAQTLEFISLGKSQAYRDVSNIYLRLRLKLMKDIAGNRPLTATDKDGVVNNISSSLFKSVQLYLNNRPVANIDTCYAYRSYFENLLNFGSEMAAVHLDPAGWAIDADKWDSITPAENSGFDKRKDMFKLSKTVECCCKVSCDFLNQNRLLLSGVEIRLLFNRESADFYVMSESASISSMQILDATLYIPHLTINPQVLLSHEALLRKHNAVYPYSRVEIKSYTVASGAKTTTLSNCIIGSLPKIILVGILETNRFVGDRTLNPFYFKNHKLSEFYAVVNGLSVPSNAVQCDFSDDTNPICSRAYDLLIRETKNYDRAHQISRKLFTDGCFLLALDLTQDKNYAGGQCYNPIRHGSLSLEFKFAEAPTDTLTILIYAEYESVIEVDSNRNVYVNY